MSAKEKNAAAKQTYSFLAPLTNEQPCEAGRNSAKRGFVSIRVEKEYKYYKGEARIMGIYLNPGNDEFYNAVEKSKIYVDKTELLEFTNSVLYGEHKNVCVSRPRRFGKSMAANMLVAYYSRGCESNELFDKLKIAKKPDYYEHLNKYNVIHINMIDFLSRADSIDALIDYLSKRLLWDIKKEYSDVDCFDWGDLVDVLETIYSEKKQPFIIIIDEWDCIFRKYPDNVEEQKKYLDFLRFFIKGKSYVALAYMTGILPIKKYGEHSALNMFDEYSMTNQRELAEFTGFTELEVKELCVRYDMSYEKMKQWYDGYELKGNHIYNPRSVVMSLLGRDYDSYWTKTETYEALKKYVQLDMYNLKTLITRLIAGESVDVNPDKFQNDMTTLESADDVLTLFVHLGYLTYDFYKQKVSIPNQEVQKEFINCIEDGGWETVMAAIRSSDELLMYTLNGDERKVASMIEQVHQENTSILKYNDENSLACVISLAYYSARKDYLMYRELAGGKGYADMVFIPRSNVNKPAIVVELKWNKTASSAIAQIKKKEYVQGLKGYSGTVILVGINYTDKDEPFKKHECRIEKISVNI